MPKAIEAPWDVIKARYIAGARPKELAQEYGLKVDTLNKRIENGKWGKLRKAVGKDISYAIERSLGERSMLLKDSLSQALVKHSKVLAEVTPRKSEVLANATTLKALAQTGAVVFAWGEANTKRPVNIAILTSNGEGIRACEGTTSVTPTIDNGDTKVLPPSDPL